MMTARNLLVGLAFAAPWLFTLNAAAQDDFMLEPAPEEEDKFIEFYLVELEAGIGYNSEDSFKFGEYTGLESEGPFFIGNVDIHGRAPSDSEEPYYVDATGTNLGLESRYARAEFGKQGDYAVFAEYDQIPHFVSRDGRTPYLGVGSKNLILPQGWVAADSTDGMTQLNPNLRTVKLETERQRVGGGIEKYFGKRWKFTTEFHHEDKEGLDSIAGVFGTTGGNPRGAILPEPIDYETNRFDAVLEYAGERAQAKLAYELSLFDNESRRLRFQNAFTNAAWDPDAEFPTGVGEIALEPDNQAHTVTFSGGYNLLRRTRVMLNASWSRHLQDDKFLFYTANPLLNAPLPLPRDSLEGEVDNYLANLRVASRPLPRTDVRASYRYWKRDNDTPQDTFFRIRGDAEDQDPAEARINLPHSLEQHKADVEAGYRILRSTKVSAGYRFERIDRDFQEVDHTTEHTVRGKVRTNPIPTVSAWAEYAHGFRDNSKYRGNEPFLESHPNAAPDDFENDPRLRKYNLAERDRDAVRGVVAYTPTPRWGFTFDVGYIKDDFDKTELGLRDLDMLNATVDASYSPNQRINSHVFFTYENRQYDQRGCSFNFFNLDCINNPPALQQQWDVETDDDVYTAGLGANWQLNEELSVGLDYLFTKARTSIDATGGSALTPQPIRNLPNIDTTRHRVGVHADYKFLKQLTARFAYLFEHLNTDDFALDDVDPDDVDEIITLGRDSPDYNAHVFGVSLIYRF
ncbi:MAG: MtrB/PioB family decaheme-associated outer membrane protein [Gammaproteobacteria bacterium]|nr:MtrB/PioB family decaheme-associated outer membrane protein [Gammaproteobacteria bacterium]NIR85645.1 MtrB/PioB family decaheme-associated outer membrane protein [Gammaproteobacteria bacterium]NIR90133.1 MtrB/PioB family decaheme-associated outer membrane protein [Gammaproteobacteria bacterium]NIU06779.1 MtrB/PioB family decaheme-associated outer membrane protein [Gammaproteobacteria bacterium]NIV53712.1 MtrB/PioB family decaheme-associated outer membrane protein [Gammaproteobacteria bacteri